MQTEAEKEEKWNQWLCEWRASGLNSTDFCRMKGIGRRQFYDCRKALAPETLAYPRCPSCKKELKTTDGLELVQVKAFRGSRLSGSGVSLSCNGILINLECGFDEGVLGSVLSVIGGCSC